MKLYSHVFASPPAVYSTLATPYFARDEWFTSVLRDIAEISNLPRDWNSYGSPPLTADAKRQAIDVALRFSTGVALPPPSVAAVSGGGVQFSWDVGAKALELEVMPDGGIDYLRIYDDDTMSEGRINPAMAADHLRQQVRWLVEHTS